MPGRNSSIQSEELNTSEYSWDLCQEAVQHNVLPEYVCLPGWGQATEGVGNTIVFTVSIDQTSASDVTFEWSTSDDSATAGNDYTAVTSQAATITAGQLSTDITLSLLNDINYEGSETLNITLSSISGAQSGDLTAVGTINDDESEPVISIADIL